MTVVTTSWSSSIASGAGSARRAMLVAWCRPPRIGWTTPSPCAGAAVGAHWGHADPAELSGWGSAAKLNIHLHCLVLDGAYRRGTDGEPVSALVPAPTDEVLQAALHKLITRMRQAARAGGAVGPGRACRGIAAGNLRCKLCALQAGAAGAAAGLKTIAAILEAGPGPPGRGAGHR